MWARVGAVTMAGYAATLAGYAVTMAGYALIMAGYAVWNDLGQSGTISSTGEHRRAPASVGACGRVWAGVGECGRRNHDWLRRNHWRPYGPDGLQHRCITIKVPPSGSLAHSNWRVTVAPCGTLWHPVSSCVVLYTGEHRREADGNLWKHMETYEGL